MDFLDIFQTSFGPSFGMKIVVFVLVDDLRRAIPADLLDLSAMFSTVDHGILLSHLWERGCGIVSHDGASPS